MVEHHLAKVRVAGSNPVFRSNTFKPKKHLEISLSAFIFMPLRTTFYTTKVFLVPIITIIASSTKSIRECLSNSSGGFFCLVHINLLSGGSFTMSQSLTDSEIVRTFCIQ